MEDGFAEEVRPSAEGLRFREGVVPCEAGVRRASIGSEESLSTEEEESGVVERG